MAELPIPAGYGVPLVDLTTGLLPEATQQVLDGRYAQPATPATPHLRRFRLTDQPLPSGSLTVVDLPEIEPAAGTGIHADQAGPGIAVDLPGLYLVSAEVRIDSPTPVWGDRTGFIIVNTVEWRCRFGQPGDRSIHLSVTNPLRLVAGDVVTLALFVQGSSDVAQGSSAPCGLSLTRLGA